MKKIFTTLAAVALALTASAQGITPVGANIAVLPSTRWSGAAYTAKVWSVNPNQPFMTENGLTNNPNYNVIMQTPAEDANGLQWYEVGYDETTLTPSDWDEGQNIAWEDHNAPFSHSTEWNGISGYQWATIDYMADIYIRRTFSTDMLLSGDVYLACGHDDAPCEYYLNGELIWSKTGLEVDHYEEKVDPITGETYQEAIYKDAWNENEYVKLTDEQKSLIKLGGEENLLAVHVHQNWGGAFADCGLYTKVEGGLEMGYAIPWDGKVIYNSLGGYNMNGLHEWEKLYEAQEGDIYTIHMDGASGSEDENGNPLWNSQVQFKTPLKLSADNAYTLAMTLTADCDYSDVRIKLTENDNDEVLAGEESISLTAGEAFQYEGIVEGMDVKNLKIVLNLAGGEPGSAVQISDMSITDSEGKELWIGCHYFNYFYMTETVTNEEDGSTTVRQLPSPNVEGRTETLAWTLPEYDDEMWDTWKMPCGNAGYMPELQTIWPGGWGHYDYTGDGWEGHNTNLWVRRTFELEKINERLSYALNVCHDDTYETYVNGHLLQKNDGWTDGKNPVQVHIPAKYLNVGKNVIATYIQQNFGGRFYDCGINVEEVNYNECAEALMAAIAKAEAEHPEFTQAIRDSLARLAAEGRAELENNPDAAELKELAKTIEQRISEFAGVANSLATVRATLALCQKENKGYITAAIENAAFIDTCLTAGEIDPFLTELRVARKRNAAERRTETFVGSLPEEGGQYYFYNVADKRFLGGGESWGAHAVTEYASNPFQLEKLTMAGEPLEKGFRIRTFRNNGYTGEGYPLEYLGYNGYVDCITDDAWEFIPVEGKTNVFNIARANGEREDGSRFLLGMRSEDNGLYMGFNQWNVVDTDLKTAELETNQWMLVGKEELDALMMDATAEHPADATHLINNPGYDQRLPIDDWYCINVGGGIGVWGRGGDFVDFVYEGWNTQSYDLSCCLFDIMPGWYEIRVQGYYRDGHYTTHLRKVGLGEEVQQLAYLYALPNGGLRMDAEEAPETALLRSYSDGINMVPGMGRRDDFAEDYTDAEGNPKHYQGDGTRYLPDACWSAAEEYFQNGLYWNSLMVYVPEGGQFRFGVFKEALTAMEGDWVVVDNWRLTYYGNQPNKPDGIGTIEAAETPAAGSPAIYNLSGQKLLKAQKGVNIIGGRKIVVK